MTSFIAPPANDARPVAVSFSSTQKFNSNSSKAASLGTFQHSPSASLEDLCRSVIVANLERYPPKSLGALSEGSWDEIVREKNERTRPFAGTGGLDGTGRLRPAISDRFLSQVETLYPHFADSSVADGLVWKDAVEYRFRSGGLTRPAALQYPWPILVEKLKESGQVLTEQMNLKPLERNQELLEQHIQSLSETPMNVSLLQSSRVGIPVKKMVKTCTKEQSQPHSANAECPEQDSEETPSVKPNASSLKLLQETLQRWKDMAKENAIARPTTTTVEGEEADEHALEQQDMQLAESCHSWRELFAVLQQREQRIRAKQGERMRESRQKLASGRPRIIKVRPTKSKHDSILDRSDKKKGGGGRFGRSTAPVSGATAKMKALRKESRIATTMSKASVRPAAKKKHSFGDAVAFATNSSPNSSSKRRAPQQIVSLGGGKRMKIPATAAGSKKRQPSFHSRLR